MTDNLVLIETKEKISQITLNRPDNRNSMTTDMMLAFHEAVKQVRNDTDVRCLIITGTGQSFCAGADLTELNIDPKDGSPSDVLMDVYRPFLNIRDIEVPVIAAMNGHAIGGGLGLALICDIRVASKNSKYGANFARLGIHSGMAISYMLPKIIGLPLANELLLTGRLINGEAAADIGLANYSEPQDNVLAKAWELAKEIAACAPAAVRMMKRSIYRGIDWAPEKAAEIEALSQAHTFQMQDAREGITALLEKREPVFRGK